jgi:hypothetical protein
MKSHLDKSASIVHSPHFENAIVKIQSGNENLTTAEKEAVAIFKLGAADTEELDEEEGKEESYTESLLRRAAQAKVNKSSYRSVAHVCPTSVIVERLFSRAKLVMTPHRRHMDPSTLEMLLLLRTNKDMIRLLSRFVKWPKLKSELELRRLWSKEMSKMLKTCDSS